MPDFKTIFDLFPTLGGDLNANYVFGAVKTVGGVSVNASMDDSQLTNLISERLNLSGSVTPGTFNVFLPSNTLVAIISPVTGIEYTHWEITINTVAVPTIDTPIVSWRNGTVPVNKELDSGTTETWRLFVYNKNAAIPTVIEVLTSSGSSGITLVPSLFQGITITLFEAIDTVGTTVVPITIEASGDITPASYFIKKVNEQPQPLELGWLPLPAVNFDVLTNGTHPLYAWVQDIEKNISSVATTSVTSTAAVDQPELISFVATLKKNTLVADIVVNVSVDVPPTHWAITENASDDTPPAAGAITNVVPIPTTHTIQAGYNTSPTPIVLRIWFKDVDGDVSLTTIQQIVTPEDVSAPSIISDFSQVIISSTILEIRFTDAVDGESGVKQYDLITDIGALVRADVSDRNQIAGLTPGGIYAWKLRAIDNHNNTSESNLSTAQTSGAAEFNITHGTHNVDETGDALAISSVDLTNTLVLNNNNRYTHGGRHDNDAGSLQGDDLAGAMALTGATELSFYRESASDADAEGMRFSYSLLEYKGGSGGDNEFILRKRFYVDLNGTTQSATYSTFTGAEIPADIDACIPHITGIMNDAATAGADSGTAYVFLSGATEVTVRKGATTDNVRVYIDLVEYVGSNWTVLHGRVTGTNSDIETVNLKTAADGVNGSTGDVLDWTNAVIFPQCIGDTNNTEDAIGSHWPSPIPVSGSTTQVNFWYDVSHAASSPFDVHFAHVLVNAEMSVWRASIGPDSSTGPHLVDITSAVLTDLAKAFIVAGATATGANTTYPGGGWCNFKFNSLIEIEGWFSGDTAYTQYMDLQVVELPGDTSGGAAVEVTAFTSDALADNSLVSSNTSLSTSGSPTQFIINYGSSAIPLLTDSWTALGSFPTILTAPDWNITIAYVWVSDGTVISRVFAPVILVPKDTIDPTAASGFTLVASDQNSITLSNFTLGTDAGSGIGLHFLLDDNNNLIKTDVKPNDVLSGLTPDTTYTWKIRVFDAHGNWADTSTVARATTSGVVGFQQDGTGDRLLTFEAEHFHRTTPGAIGESWASTQATANYVGDGAIVQGSASSYSIDPVGSGSPKLEFDINSAVAGDLYVFARVWAPDNDHRSFYVMKQSEGVPYRINATVYGQWAWTAAHFVGDFSSGAEVIELLKDTTGPVIDRLVFTTNATYDPSAVNGGNGPAESSEIISGSTPDPAFFANGDANWLKKDEVIAQLTTMAPTIYAQGTNGLVIEGKKFFSSNADGTNLTLPNCHNGVVQNCYFDTAALNHILCNNLSSGWTFRNNYLTDNNTGLTQWGVEAILAYETGSSIHILGNYFHLCNACAAIDGAGGTKTDYKINWNYIDSRIVRVPSGNAVGLGYRYSWTLTDAQMNHNVQYDPDNLDHGEDLFSLYRSSGTPSSYLQMNDNSQWGGTIQSPYSAAFIIAGDVGGPHGTIGHVEANDNVSINGSTCLPSFTGNYNSRALRNKGFLDRDYSATIKIWQVLSAIWRQGGCVPGEMFNIEYADNIASGYAWLNGTEYRMSVWNPNTGGDSWYGGEANATYMNETYGCDFPFYVDLQPNVGTMNGCTPVHESIIGDSSNDLEFDEWQEIDGVTGLKKGYSIWNRDPDGKFEYAGIKGDGNVQVTLASLSFSVITSAIDQEDSSQGFFPTHQVIVSRTGDTSSAVSCKIVSSDISAIAGINYRIVDETVSFAAAQLSKTVNIRMYFEVGLSGTVPKTLNLILSSPSAGAAIGFRSAHTISVYGTRKTDGTNGYFKNGDVDWNNEPSNLAVITSQQTSGGTWSFTKFDGDAIGTGKSIFEFSNNDALDLSNCLLDGAALKAININGNGAITLRNSRIFGSNRDKVAYQWGHRAVELLYKDLGNIKLLGNYIEDVNGGFSLNECDADSGQDQNIAYNFFTKIWWNGHSDDLPSAVSNWFNNTQGKTLIHDNAIFDRYDYSGEDVFGSGSSGGAAPGQGPFYYDNISWTRLHGSISWTVCQTSEPHLDPDGASYSTWLRNTCIDANNMRGMGSGHGHLVDGDKGFTSRIAASLAPNYYGTNVSVMAVGRKVDVVTAGKWYDCVIKNITALLYRSDGAGGVSVATVWTSPPWDDYPIHGPAGGGGPGDPEQDLFTTGNDLEHSAWDGTGSEGANTFGYDDLFWNKKRVLRWPTNCTGWAIRYAYQAQGDENPGRGTLTFTLSGTTLTWAEYGDTPGAAVDVSSYSNLDEVILFSNNGSRLHLRRNVVALPGSDKVDADIIVSNIHFNKWMYAGLDGSGDSSA